MANSQFEDILRKKAQGYKPSVPAELLSSIKVAGTAGAAAGSAGLFKSIIAKFTSSVITKVVATVITVGGAGYIIVDKVVDNKTAKEEKVVVVNKLDSETKLHVNTDDVKSSIKIKESSSLTVENEEGVNNKSILSQQEESVQGKQAETALSSPEDKSFETGAENSVSLHSNEEGDILGNSKNENNSVVNNEQTVIANAVDEKLNTKADKYINQSENAASESIGSNELENNSVYEVVDENRTASETDLNSKEINGESESKEGILSNTEKTQEVSVTVATVDSAASEKEEAYGLRSGSEINSKEIEKNDSEAKAIIPDNNKNTSSASLEVIGDFNSEENTSAQQKSNSEVERSYGVRKEEKSTVEKELTSGLLIEKESSGGVAQLIQATSSVESGNIISEEVEQEQGIGQDVEVNKDLYKGSKENQTQFDAYNSQEVMPNIVSSVAKEGEVDYGNIINSNLQEKSSEEMPEYKNGRSKEKVFLTLGKSEQERNVNFEVPSKNHDVNKLEETEGGKIGANENNGSQLQDKTIKVNDGKPLEPVSGEKNVNSLLADDFGKSEKKALSGSRKKKANNKNRGKNLSVFNSKPSFEEPKLDMESKISIMPFGKAGSSILLKDKETWGGLNETRKGSFYGGGVLLRYQLSDKIELGIEGAFQKMTLSSNYFSSDTLDGTIKQDLDLLTLKVGGEYKLLGLNKVSLWGGTYWGGSYKLNHSSILEGKYFDRTFKTDLKQQSTFNIIGDLRLKVHYQFSEKLALEAAMLSEYITILKKSNMINIGGQIGLKIKW